MDTHNDGSRENLWKLTPEDVLRQISAGITPRGKLAFISGLIFAALTHLYYFTGRFTNEDDLHRILPPVWNLAQGRWADGFKFSSAWPLPGVLFFFTIIFLALTVCLTVSVLNIEKPSSVMLTALAVVSFPSLAYSFGYIYGVEQYVLALFFSALAVWVTKGYRWGFLAGIPALAYSMGQYQSYLAYAMGLCACSLALLLLDRQRRPADCAAVLGRYAVTGAGGVAGYMAVLNLCLRLTGTELSAYKGIDSMGEIKREEILPLFQKTYERVFGFLTGRDFFGADRAVVVFYWICVLAAAILLIRLILRDPSPSGMIRGLLAAALLALLPFCVDVVDFAAPQADASALNAYALVLIFTAPTALWELDCRCSRREDEKKKEKLSRASVLLSWVLLLSTLAVSWSFVVQTNLYYSKISLYYEYTTAFYNRVLERIESLPGYETDMPVAILSDRTVVPYGDDTSLYSDRIIDDQGLWGKFTGLNHGMGAESTVTQKGIAIMKNSLGVPLTGATMGQINEIKETKEYKQMGVWPESDSVKLIDGIAVVNFLIEQESSLTAQDGVLRMDVKIDADRFPDAQYTWYVYKNHELTAVRPAGPQSRFEFHPEGSGIYYGKYVVDTDAHKWTCETAPVTVP